ncbi:hypothetical protein XENTR_v10017269 [Xenopus tropicalis]|nr:hypothetical protein XENTR_v10017269 [Xenopus tropicalis]
MDYHSFSAICHYGQQLEYSFILLKGVTSRRLQRPPDGNLRILPADVIPTPTHSRPHPSSSFLSELSTCRGWC